MATLVALSLVGGIAATAREARIAKFHEARAERRFNDVRKLANSFLFEFHDAIQNLPGSTKVRQLVVARALEYLDSLSKEAQEDVPLQREVATAYQKLADAQGGAGAAHLGDTKGALASYDKAYAIWRALAASPAETQDEEGLASLETKLSRTLFAAGDPRRAEETARSAATRLQRLMGKSRSDLRAELASAYHTLGYIAARRGDEAAAFEWLDKAAAAAKAYCDAHPDDGSAQSSLAHIQSDLVERLGRRGEYRRAVELALSARGILERLVAAEPNNARYQRFLATALNMGSEQEEAAGDVRAAIVARRRSLELAEALVAADPGNQGDRILLAYSQHGLGASLVHSGETEEGLGYLRQAVRSAEDTVKADPSNAFVRRRLAEIQAELGLALHGLGRRTAEMCASLQHSVTFWEGLAREGHLPGEIRDDFGKTRAALSTCPIRGR